MFRRVVGMLVAIGILAGPCLVSGQSIPSHTVYVMYVHLQGFGGDFGTSTDGDYELDSADPVTAGKFGNDLVFSYMGFINSRQVWMQVEIDGVDDEIDAILEVGSQNGLGQPSFVSANYVGPAGKYSFPYALTDQGGASGRGTFTVTATSDDGSLIGRFGGSGGGSYPSWLNDGPTTSSYAIGTPSPPSTPTDTNPTFGTWTRLYQDEPDTDHVQMWDGSSIQNNFGNLPSISSRSQSWTMPFTFGSLPNPFAATGLSGITLTTDPQGVFGGGAFHAAMDAVAGVGSIFRAGLLCMAYLIFVRAILRSIGG